MIVFLGLEKVFPQNQLDAPSYMSLAPPSNTSLACGGYNARVLVDGKEVPHYSIEVNEEKKESICWIASESGKVDSSTHCQRSNLT